MSKYTKETVSKICAALRDGDNMKLACVKAGISDETFMRWRKKYVDFMEAIKAAKDDFEANILKDLEATLWKRAKGYVAEDTETEYVDDGTGRPKIRVQKTKKKNVPPDTGALIFALTNVAPEKWINRQKIDTHEVKEIMNKEQDYHFEDLPEDMLREMADRLQDARYERIKAEKERKQGE